MPRKKRANTLKPVGVMLIGRREVQFASYHVEEGDTVFNLWLKLRAKTTVGAIKQANGIETNELKVGSTIKIPLVY